MTSKAALALALLEGRVLNIKNCFTEIGLTNISREIPRLIEKPFGVQVSRTPRTGQNRYGEPVSYMDYRLNKTEMNALGRAKMSEYCKSQIGTMTQCKTEKERTLYIQTNLFLETL